MLKKIAGVITLLITLMISFYLNRYHQFSVLEEFLIVIVAVLTWLIVCLIIDSVRKY